MLRKASGLPLTFFGDRSIGIGSARGMGGDSGSSRGCCFDCVGSGMAGVASNVGCCRSVPGGMSCSTSRSIIAIACGSMSGKCSGPSFAYRNLPLSPAASCFDSVSRSMVIRMLRLEDWEYTFGAIDSPACQ